MTKKVILIVSILAALLIFLPSCAGVVPQEEYQALQSMLEEMQGEVDTLQANQAALQTDYEGLQSDYNSLQGNYEKLQSDYESLHADYAGLQADYESSLERLEQSELEDPTWSELKKFLKRDDTDEIPYVENSFDCSGYAITLRDRAWRYGMRCAYVEIGFSAGDGHALNAFDTTDEGLIYVDDTEADQIAYVEVGEPYGVIMLDAVKSSYIACSVSPDLFWGDLSCETHSSHPFNYDYYLDYQRRVQFYEETVDAYNEAVDEYNRGGGDWTRSQLTEWQDNIEDLKGDLGAIFYEPGGEVESIEFYWN